MPLHFLDPLQFQLQTFDCIILGLANLPPRGGRTYPMTGQVRPSWPVLLEWRLPFIVQRHMIGATGTGTALFCLTLIYSFADLYVIVFRKLCSFNNGAELAPVSPTRKDWTSPRNTCYIIILMKCMIYSYKYEAILKIMLLYLVE